jgi:hypothetical protein
MPIGVKKGDSFLLWLPDPQVPLSLRTRAILRESFPAGFLGTPGLETAQHLLFSGTLVPDKSQPKGKTYLCQANWAAECRAGCSPTSGVRGITGELLRHPLLFRQSWGRKKVCSPRNQPLATFPPCGPKWAMACHLAQLPLPGEKDPEQSRYLPLGRYKLPEGASEEPARQ